MTYKLIITQNQMKRFFRKTRYIKKDLLKKIIKNFIVQILWNERDRLPESPLETELTLRSDLFSVTQAVDVEPYYNNPTIFPDACERCRQKKLEAFSWIQYDLEGLLHMKKYKGKAVVIELKFSENGEYVDADAYEVD